MKNEKTTHNTLTEDMHILGPQEGFSPQVGTLLSMMTWMRNSVVRSVENLTQEALDHQLDPNANSIGAMLLHLAAVEKRYQIKTFDWDFDSIYDGSINWEAAMLLGVEGQKHIRGNSIDYYLNILNQTRLTTLHEFKNRDDSWLFKVDPLGFHKMPTNNYCKWFHVVEHESHHNGQIKWIKNRLPGLLANANS